MTLPIVSSAEIWLSRSGSTGASPMWLPAISPLGRFALQIACRARDGPNLQHMLIDPRMCLAPDPPFRATMLTGVPLAFALDRDAGAIHCPAGITQ